MIILTSIAGVLAVIIGGLIVNLVGKNNQNTAVQACRDLGHEPGSHFGDELGQVATMVCLNITFLNYDIVGRSILIALSAQV